MKIVFLDILNEQHNGEYEALLRIEHVLNIQGHTLLKMNRYGFVMHNGRVTHRHVEDLEADFFFTFDPIERAVTVYPDLFGAFVHWAPTGYFENYKALLCIQNLHSFDAFGYSSQPQLFTKIAGIPAQNLPLIGPSVPKDYVIPAAYIEKRRLFYIGINVERALQSMRYGTLLKVLDETGRLDIYGPKCVYGTPNLWAGFSSYKGEIPFDGRSILSRIHSAGICLALNSPMHNDAAAVTSRLYEGAAAGAVIISDDNAFVRRYFGDSVFYVAPELPEEDASKRILEILDWVNEHPQEAYEMAQASQRIFLQNLSLDEMVAGFLEGVCQRKAQMQDPALQTEVLDVICFVESEQDYGTIMDQLERQYYQNLHLIVVSDPAVYETIHSRREHDFVPWQQGHEGRAMCLVRKWLRGNYFMFLDRNCVMHKRHISKNFQILSGRNELFAYSGCYLVKPQETEKRYVVLNNKPILRDEFLLFSSQEPETLRRFRHIEMVFSRSCVLFRKELWDHISDDELSQISCDVHYYFACAALISTGLPGRFTYAVTTGYAAPPVEALHRRLNAAEHLETCQITEELFLTFSQYTYEVYPRNCRVRNDGGEITWNEEAQPAVLRWKIIKRLKPLVPLSWKAFVKRTLLDRRKK